MRITSRNRVSRIARRTVLNCDICVHLRQMTPRGAKFAALQVVILNERRSYRE